MQWFARCECHFHCHTEALIQTALTICLAACYARGCPIRGAAAHLHGIGLTHAAVAWFTGAGRRLPASCGRYHSRDGSLALSQDWQWDELSGEPRA